MSRTAMSTPPVDRRTGQEARSDRVRTGVWPPLTPRATGRSAAALPPETQVVATWDENFQTIYVNTEAAFTRYTPPSAPRATYPS